MWGALIPAAAQVAGSALGGPEGGGPNVSGAPVTFAPSYGGKMSLDDPKTLALIVGLGLLTLYAVRKAR